MILDPADQERFFRLHKALMLYVNRELRLVAEPSDPGEEFTAFPLQERLLVRDALSDRPDLIDRFVEKDPFGFEPDELEIIASWRAMVAGEFYLLKLLKNHAIFLSAAGPPAAYGVVALSDPFEAMFGDDLPRLLRTVLLPFKGRIVYDGLLVGHDVVFGRNITRELTGAYNDAKKRAGVVTSLPPPGKKRASGKKKAAKKKEPVKAADAPATRKAPKVSSKWLREWRVTRAARAIPGFKLEFSADPPGQHIVFQRGHVGAFRMGTLSGELDFREAKRDGEPAVEFSWLGEDNLEPASGRGWAALDDDAIEGRIFVHGADDFAFRAERKKK